MLGRMLALTFLGTMIAGPASLAQVPTVQPAIPCHDYKEIARQLGNRYEEAPVSLGMQSNGNVLQVFASKDKESWTILSVSPEGTGCILAAGRRWEDMPIERDGPEA
ncbi:MAG: hypothetical protein R3C70_15990 [Geminicoccaceae bacterium]|nr:hypothetical protein [Geminicoccaceae bacterium]